jgi:recombination protein RecA
VRVKVVKNKMAAPFKQAEFDVMFDEGISRIGDILDLASAKGIVKKSGSWFSYGEEKLGQGREGVKAYLTENPKIWMKIEEELRKEFFSAGKNTQTGPEARSAVLADGAELSSVKEKPSRKGTQALND